MGYFFVGLFASILHWLTRIFLSVWISFNYAVALSYSVGMLVSFLLNSFFVFNKSSIKRKKQAIKFILTSLLSFPVVWLCSIYLNDYLNFLGVFSFSEEISHGLALCFPMLVSFIIYKFVIFK